jgi:hypothetical protein
MRWPLLFLPALVGCNAIFGLDEVDVRSSSGGGATTTVGPSSGSSTTATSGSGGSAPSRKCHDPEYMQGLILDGSFEGNGWNYANGNLNFDWGNAVTPLCQDTFYIAMTGDGPPRTAAYLQGAAITGALNTDPCLEWSIAARDPNGQSPHLWITFDVQGSPGDTTNTITPTSGVQVTGLDWKFYSGSCRMTVPQIPSGAIVGIWGEAGHFVHFDAIEAHTIACDASIPNCDP